MSLPRYPEYKDSGVAWFGRIPDHWGPLRFKWLIERNDGGVWGDDPEGEGDTVVLRSTEQTVDGRWKIDDPARRNLSERDRLSATLKEGDLLVTKSSGSALHIGKTTLVDEYVAGLCACYSNFMQRVRLGGRILPRLAWYVLNNNLARVQLDLASNSTTGLANLNGTMIGELLLVAPSLDEQGAIVTFLDRETARIDALIAEQEKLLELLAEKRQATISHAVTRGLDPDVPMKDSGIAWLGEVPAHWDFLPCRAVVSERIEKNHGGGNENYLSLVANVGIMPYAEKGDVGNKKPEDLGKCKMVEIGDLVINSMNYGIGSYGLSSHRGVCSPVYIILRTREDRAIKEFVYRIFQNRDFQVFAQSFGNGILAHRSAIGWDTIKNLCIAVPAIGEQREIVKFIEKVEADSKRMARTAERAIELLRERRGALISAAVTGQIDVRALAGEEAA